MNIWKEECHASKVRKFVEKVEVHDGKRRHSNAGQKAHHTPHQTGLLGFIQEGREHYDLSVGAVLSRNFEKLTDLINPANAHMALKLHVLTNCWGRISRYFKSEKLRRAFTFQVFEQLLDLNFVC